jgi:hypothetical protein
MKLQITLSRLADLGILFGQTTSWGSGTKLFGTGNTDTSYAFYQSSNVSNYAWGFYPVASIAYTYMDPGYIVLRLINTYNFTINDVCYINCVLTMLRSVSLGMCGPITLSAKPLKWIYITP